MLKSVDTTSILSYDGLMQHLQMVDHYASGNRFCYRDRKNFSKKPRSISVLESNETWIDLADGSYSNDLVCGEKGDN